MNEKMDLDTKRTNPEEKISLVNWKDSLGNTSVDVINADAYLFRRDVNGFIEYRPGNILITSRRSEGTFISVEITDIFW